MSTALRVSAVAAVVAAAAVTAAAAVLTGPSRPAAGAADAGMVQAAAKGTAAKGRAQPQQGVPPLPLGPAGLRQSQSTRQLAPGVTLTTITRGHASPADHWTVTVGFEATRAKASALAGKLRAHRFKPTVTAFGDKPAGDRAPGPLGYLVRVGDSRAQAGARELAGKLSADGFSAPVTNTALLSPSATGPWEVRELRVDPRYFHGHATGTLSNGIVPGSETVSSMVSRLGALAGVNGGYFIINPGTGTLGAASGVQAVNGDLDAETDTGRAALVLPGGTVARAGIARLDTSQTVTSSDGSAARLTGLDRAPGYVRDCTEPEYRVRCATRDDLVAFDSRFGPHLGSGTGAEAILGARGRVLALRDSRGGTLATGKMAIEGIGTGAAWLRAHARPGAVLHVSKSVGALNPGRPAAAEARGKALPAAPGAGQQGRATRGIALTSGLSIVNGGPLLVQDGRPDLDAQAEGFNPPSRPSKYFGFGVTRNPRTMAGLTRGHDLLLVTVDGRQPGYSIGLSFGEEAKLMAALGSVSAMNLDGGGSADMVAGGQVRGRPSDGSERPVGDAVLIDPSAR
jgi:Phosphodiester glycosidase